MDNHSHTIIVTPVVASDAPDAHRVEWKIGVRSFHIGADYWETREEAELTAKFFQQALDEYRNTPEADDLRVIVNVAKRWASFQEPDSLHDQRTDARLRQEANDAAVDLRNALEALSDEETSRG